MVRSGWVEDFSAGSMNSWRTAPLTTALDLCRKMCSRVIAVSSTVLWVLSQTDIEHQQLQTWSALQNIRSIFSYPNQSAWRKTERQQKQGDGKAEWYNTTYPPKAMKSFCLHVLWQLWEILVTDSKIAHERPLASYFPQENREKLWPTRWKMELFNVAEQQGIHFNW